MEYITDRELLKSTLDEMGLSGRFDSPGLQFQLVEYHKGELLAAPFKPMDRLLFLVRGRVSIYGLREDGTAAMEYYVNTGLTDIYCVPASFWEEGGSQEQLDFYRVIHWEGTNGFLTLHYPWMRVN